MPKIRKIWEMIGKNNTQRFWRFVLLVGLITLSVNLIQNLKFGYNQKDGKCERGWWFEWGPAAEIKINRQ